MKIVPFVLLIALSPLAQPTNAAPNVRAWGDNTYGQCNVPEDLTNAIAVAAGTKASMALRADGTVVEWGNPPYHEPPLANVVGISVDTSTPYDEKWAVLADGTYTCWGGSIQDCPTNFHDVAFPAISNIFKIVAVGGGALVLISDGKMSRIRGWLDMQASVFSPPPASGGNDYVDFCVSAPSIDLNNVITVHQNGTVSLDYHLYFYANWFPHIPSNCTNATSVALCRNTVAILLSGGSVTGGTYYQPNDFRYVAPIVDNNVASISGGPGGLLATHLDGTVWCLQGTNMPNIQVPADLPFTLNTSVGRAHYLAVTRPGEIPPPRIIRQPRSQTVPVGAQVLIYAGVSGIEPLAYQWFFNSTNVIPGAASRGLTLNDVQVSNAGAYSIVASNQGGSVTSNPALLSVVPAMDVKMVPSIFITGSIGTTYRLDYINVIGPTNAWSNLATLTLTSNPEIYVDFTAIGQPARYYRMVQVP